MASLLSQTPLNQEQSDYVRTIQTSGEHLLTVLNDILDYSKQQSGKMDLELAETDPCATIEQAVELGFRNDRQLELVMEYAGDDAPLADDSLATAAYTTLSAAHVGRLPHLILSDVTRLRQVLVNLLSNACKFTGRGGTITVALRLGSKHAATGATLSYDELEQLVKDGHVAGDFWNNFHTWWALQPCVKECRNTRFLELEFSVRDTGIGIPANQLHKLFKAFSQCDSSTTRQYGGTGLGLVTSSTLAHLMGGRMWCASEEGKGATFHFTIITPVIAHKGAEEQGFSVNRKLLFPAGSRRQVLLMSAHAALRASVIRQLTRWGFEVKAFDNASDTSHWYASQSASVQRAIACVLVDYVCPMISSATAVRQLTTGALTTSPIGDIHELTQVIRLADSRADSPTSTPIMYLNSDLVLSSEVAALMELGVIISRKPLLFNKLRAQMDNFLHPRASPSVHQICSPKKLADRWPLSILVCEDNKVNMKVALKQLHNMGYQPQCAYNGQVAVDMVVGAHKHFDLIFMDMFMRQTARTCTQRAGDHSQRMCEAEPLALASCACCNGYASALTSSYQVRLRCRRGDPRALLPVVPRVPGCASSHYHRHDGVGHGQRPPRMPTGWHEGLRRKATHIAIAGGKDRAVGGQDERATNSQHHVSVLLCAFEHHFSFLLCAFGQQVPRLTFGHGQSSHDHGFRSV